MRHRHSADAAFRDETLSFILAYLPVQQMPPSLSLLLNFPNALITAHQAFLTREALGEIARVTTASILQLAAGEASPVWLEGTLLA
jgi:phosphoglycerate dehydrogenase-like enzyme